jgi:hypothetical protein
MNNFQTVDKFVVYKKKLYDDYRYIGHNQGDSDEHFPQNREMQSPDPKKSHLPHVRLPANRFKKNLYNAFLRWRCQVAGYFVSHSQISNKTLCSV